MGRRWPNRTMTGLICCLLASVLAAMASPALPVQAGATGAGRPLSKRVAQPSAGSAIPLDRRGEVLPAGWRASADTAWTTSGDQTGFHLLAATEASGYAWRTVAALSEPGIETDRWIGNVCFTESGRRAVVVYAPRAFTNKDELFDRGGFTAVIDTQTGQVTKIPVRASLAYFNPGCGDRERAVVTQARGENDPTGKHAATRLVGIDAAAGKVTGLTELPGQVTSAIPVPGGAVVAAGGRHLIAVDGTGRVRKLASAASTPFRLTPDAAGGVLYLEQADGVAHVQHLPDASRAGFANELARGPLATVNLLPGVHKQAFITGDAKLIRTPPASVRHIGVPSTAEISSSGHLAILHGSDTAAPDEPGELRMTAKVITTGKTIDFAVTPGIRSAPGIDDGSKAHPLNAVGAASPRAAVAATGSSTEPPDSDAWCSVPRNDPRTQAYQPTPRQVEWAADQAVVGNLTVNRPANWKQSGLPSYSPQGLFPPIPLTGGGRVPVQIFLGIMAQESNLWQASGHSLSGTPGNPLIGNFYGRQIYDKDQSNDWDIHWADSDCGYGLTQITDGMRKAEHPKPGEVILPATQQRAAALDYTANIAGGLRILQSKWNLLKTANIIHDTGDPQWLENWFFAVWAYNSGLQPDATHGNTTGCTPSSNCTDAAGNWGLGWGNNPVNPKYPANRAFFNQDPHDPSHPQDWPYPEKVLGWAAFSISTPDGVGFRPAWWVSVAYRSNAKPPINAFCVQAVNKCVPGASYTPNDPDVVGEPAGPCGSLNGNQQYDLHCWWHQSMAYQDCAHGYCGHELLRFDNTYPEQPDGTHNPPACTVSALPAGSYVIDDVDDSVPSVRKNNDGSDCGRPWTNAGSFSLRFAGDGYPLYPSKADFHQLGAGFGGHFWFAHTRKSSDEGGRLEVTGTWNFDVSFNGWERVLVHIPDIGAQTQQARYDIDLGNGTVKSRYLSQRLTANQWVSLGVMRFSGKPSITLSSQTWDGRGEDDVAWDAVAIEPLLGKPQDFVVALGDSFSSGEGANDATDGDDYYKETDVNGELDDDKGRNACHRSPWAWARRGVLADDSRSIGQRADSLDDDLDFQFLACSGARTHNILPEHTVPSGQDPPVNAFGRGGAGQYGEVSQIDKGYLDENTTLVTLSMGGNDARFADVVKQCIYIDLVGDCQDGTMSGETEPLKLSLPGHISNEVHSSIVQMLIEIHKRAPNAKVVLMGYPDLLENDGNCIVKISPNEARWLSTVADYLAAEMGQTASEATAAGVPTWFANPIARFDGRGICGYFEAINGIVVDTTAGDKPPPLPSSQSFHPNISGTHLYGEVLQQTLGVMGV